MISRCLISVLLALSLLAGNGYASSVNCARDWGFPYDTFTLHSSTINQTFEINVQVPEHCRSNKCPVVYGVDSDLFFGALTNAAYYLKQSVGPAVIIVGIGYEAHLV